MAEGQGFDKWMNPGSTNSRGFVKHLHEAMERIYTWIYGLELRKAREEHVEQCREAANKQQKPKFEPPAKRKGTAGGGSLSAAGAPSAQSQHRRAFTAVQPELLGVLSWLLQESAVDSAVPGKLWDAVTWDRPVMSSAKAFEVKDPVFIFFAAGHLRELLQRLQHDTLGLRQCLTVVFARPLFLNLEEIAAACGRLPAETKGRPQVFRPFCLRPLLALRLAQEERAFAQRPARCLRLQGMALCKWGSGLNLSNQKQKAHFLEKGTRNLSKYRGKLNTKSDRMVLGIYYLDCLAKHFRTMQEALVPMDSPAPSRILILSQVSSWLGHHALRGCSQELMKEWMKATKNG